jgi:hypothetical protein
MAYDGAAGNIVLFGGESSLIPAGTDLNDTWTWDGTTWTQQFPPVSPSARTYMGMVYDEATKTVVLFGGANNWRQIHPATVPPNRYLFGMDYDPVHHDVLMFGGYSSTVVRSDTWLLALEP